MSLFNIFKRKPDRLESIIVVSGLPRSGTSMMMQILEAAGVSPITDNTRTADINNTKGYYEHESTKALATGNHDWLKNAEGKSIKVISSLLKHLPTDRHYKVIFMRRELNDVLASQAQMLENMGKVPKPENDAKLKSLYTKHLSSTSNWLADSAHIDELQIDYNHILAEPHIHLKKMLEFLGISAKPEKMVAVVDQAMRHHNLP